MKIYSLFWFILIPLQLIGQNEIKINSYSENHQYDPHIVTDNQGQFLAIWTSFNQVSVNSEEDIFMQYLNADLVKTGDEIQVNDITAKDQIRPDAALNEKGNLIVTWASNCGPDSLYDIKAKLFLNGSAVSHEFLVNTETAHSQTKPSVDIYNDGSFVIVWESWFEDGSDRGIYAQKFFNDGNKNGIPFQVNVNAKFSQAKPVIKYFPDGKFIVVWESWNQESPSSSGYGLFGRIYDSEGQPLSGEIRINDYTPDYQWYADVVTLDNESFAVAWCSWEQDGSDGGIYIKRFNTNWESLSSETRVNSNRRYYQWLPKLALLPGGNIAVVWSSWQQDGSREGIYAKILDGKLNERSFEFRLNDTTENFQWEPDIAVLDDSTLIAVWSNYNEAEKNYDVIGKQCKILIKETLSVKSSYDHPSGLSTTSFIVNVVDSALLTGDTYEITFGENSSNRLYSSIKNINQGIVKVPELSLDQGEDVYYLSQVFDGVAVEIRPVFSLEVDFTKSLFVNNSGSNINFNFINPSGKTVVAPIDLVIEWGDFSKNPDGTYSAPLDSAYSSSGKIEIKTPFKAWDLTNNKKLNCYIIEPSSGKNKQWDPGESIVILTPEEYQLSFPNFHVQINNTVPAGSINYPAPGDSIFIFTKRPLTVNDVYTFSTSAQFITGVKNEKIIPGQFLLEQNYPNPFNPSTTISFSIAEDSNVKLKVYNILGQLVKTLKDEYMQKGNHRILFSSGTNDFNLSSGVYFYSLESNNKFITRKMLLVK